MKLETFLDGYFVKYCQGYKACTTMPEILKFSNRMKS